MEDKQHVDVIKIYDHHRIQAESIMSIIDRSPGNGPKNGDCREYNTDELRENWNHWCQTKENF